MFPYLDAAMDQNDLADKPIKVSIPLLCELYEIDVEVVPQDVGKAYAYLDEQLRLKGCRPEA